MVLSDSLLNHYFYLCYFQIRYCEDLGISAEKASKLFIYYGGCSAIGRVLAGILCSHRRINAFFIFQAAEFVAGLSTILVTLTSSYSWLVVYIVIYGLSDGFFFTSLSINLLTACPLKTPAVLGWEMLLASLTLASGPPLAGMCNVSCRLYQAPGRSRQMPREKTESERGLGVQVASTPRRRSFLF